MDLECVASFSDIHLIILSLQNSLSWFSQYMFIWFQQLNI